uniref:Synaptopodin 2 n=1 Tax=Scleropages formosus TaxID=113540 RepID=A0A8C9U042_SCLFO
MLLIHGSERLGNRLNHFKPFGFLLVFSKGEPSCNAEGPAALVGLAEGDQLVSLNDQPCADVALSEIMALADGSAHSNTHWDTLDQGESTGENLESTTLEIWPARRALPTRELYISESQDEAYYGEAESDAETSCRLETFSPGAMVELQLSLSDHSLDEAPPGRNAEVVHTCSTTHSLYVSSSGKQSPARPPSSLAQVEVTLQCHPRDSRDRVEADLGADPGGGGQADPEDAADPSEVPLASVSFGFSPEELDSEPEKDTGKPNKHRARHARFRRSESQSEKQVKEAKSKCRRIALLLTAAPNPNNKGVLMFKKHRQRAKQFTLVSYGTGDDAPEDEGNEGEEGGKEHAVEFTVLATSESELDEEIFAKAQSSGSLVTFDWDTGLLEIERKLEDQEEMEHLPETKGKGALMFAQRRQRVDEITAEHEEMRRKGIPVEGVKEVQSTSMSMTAPYHMQERSYMQSVDSQIYMHVNLQQHESSTVILNRTAKPFSGVQNKAPTPFSPSRDVTSSDQLAYSTVPSQGWSPVVSGEQIASRDERISVPAIRTGILQETRRRNTSKPMFTFKDPPKVSPNPELLNLLNKSNKKAGFELGAEEDYLSLGAEACNFLQSPKVKQKIPPPVAPKPIINPASPPWSPPPDSGDQAPSHPEHTELTQASSTPPMKTWNQPQSPSNSAPPLQRMNSYTQGSSAPTGNLSVAGGVGSAFEMPALRGKGAELFAKRQSRMEKFVVDSSTVQANKVRSSSPTPSLPSSWKYSPNIRAPPPLAYNPIQSPSYPPGAMKQPSPSTPSSNTKNKGKARTAPKPLHALDVMKHQPYQLNSSLFIYGSAVEAKSPPSKAAPTPTPAPVTQSQPVRYEPFTPAQPITTPYAQQPQPHSYRMASPSTSLQIDDILPSKIYSFVWKESLVDTPTYKCY